MLPMHVKIKTKPTNKENPKQQKKWKISKFFRFQAGVEGGGAENIGCITLSIMSAL